MGVSCFDAAAASAAALYWFILLTALFPPRAIAVTTVAAFPPSCPRARRPTFAGWSGSGVQLHVLWESCSCGLVVVGRRQPRVDGGKEML